jgi:hypothetical protein
MIRLAIVQMLMRGLSLLFLKMTDHYPKKMDACIPFDQTFQFAFEISQSYSPQSISDIESKTFEAYFEIPWLYDFQSSNLSLIADSFYLSSSAGLVLFNFLLPKVTRPSRFFAFFKSDTLSVFHANEVMYGTLIFKNTTNIIKFETQIVPSQFSQIEAKFENPDTFKSGCLNISFESPCSFIPKSSIIELNFEIDPKNVTNNDVDVFNVFNKDLCDVRINGLSSPNKTCSKEKNVLRVFNLFANDTFSSKFSLRICNITTPIKNAKNPKIIMYNNYGIDSKIFASSSFHVDIANPVFYLKNQDISNKECGASFEYSMLVVFPEPLEINSEFSVDFQFDGGFIDAKEIFLSSNKLGLEKKKIAKSAENLFKLNMDLFTARLQEIDFRIEGIKNPQAPGDYKLKTYLNFDLQSSLSSMIETKFQFYYVEIPGLTLSLVNTDYIDLKKISMTFTERIVNKEVGSVIMFLRFENSFSWHSTSTISISGQKYEYLRKQVNYSEYNLGFTDIQIPNSDKVDLVLENLQINTNLIIPASCEVRIYANNLLSYLKVFYIQTSPIYFKNNELSFKKVNDEFVIAGFLNNNLLSDSNALFQIKYDQNLQNLTSCAYIRNIDDPQKICEKFEDLKLFQIENDSNFNSNFELLLRIDSKALVSMNSTIINFSLKTSNDVNVTPRIKTVEKYSLSIHSDIFYSCERWSLKENSCSSCAQDYSMLDSKSPCRKIIAVPTNSRPLVLLNMSISDFISKIFSGFIMNLLIMVFFLSFILKFLFTNHFHWIEFHAIISKLMWFFMSYSYFVYILYSFDAPKLKNLLLITIHISINTTASVYFYFKFTSFYETRLWISKLIIVKAFYSLLIIVAGVSPIPLMTSFKDSHYYFQYFVPPELQTQYLGVSKFMMWYNLIFHFSSFTIMLILLIPRDFEQMILLLLIISLNLVLNSCILIIKSRGSKGSHIKQFSAKANEDHRLSSKDISEIDALINLEFQNNKDRVDGELSVDDYLPLRNVLEKIQALEEITLKE